ncbi:MAG: DsbA family protein, partial [Phormidesmis sp.]
HFPLKQYPRSQKAAETAEAAASQDKFWEMHNKLFSNQQALDDASLVEYAIELGLDLPQFLYELTHNVHVERVDADAETAKHYGVENTPTFFISVRQWQFSTQKPLAGRR